MVTWSPGDYIQDVNGHEVYFGTDEDAVTDANISNVGSDPNVDLYIVSDPCFEPGATKHAAGSGTGHLVLVDYVIGCSAAYVVELGDTVK